MVDYELDGIPELSKTDTKKSLMIGVVITAKVDKHKRYTDIEFYTDKDKTLKLRMKYNAGFLCGKLCIYNKKLQEMWPVEDSTKKFRECKSGEEEKIPNQVTVRKPLKKPKLVECPICFKKVYSNRKKKHIKYCSGN